MRVSLAEYAALHGKAPVTVRQMIQRGNLKTAEKIGGSWTVDDGEPYPDNRLRRPVEPDDLEMRDGMYVIDEIAYRASSSSTTFVRIGDRWYTKGKCLKGHSRTNPAPVPVRGDPWAGDTDGKCNETWFFAAQNYGCVPRDTGFVLAGLGRAATQQEVADIAAEYGARRLEDRDVTLGAFYGPDYTVTIREAVLELPGGINPAEVESRILRSGIAASNTSPTTVGIRIG